MVGHETIIDNLKTLAKRGGLSHGYIFHGPSMVGKRTVALALAHFLEKGEFEPPAAHEVLQDAKLISAVADSIGIDAVREIKNFLWQKPNASAKRTLIIDDAELLTTEAQNALLKLTEEPPASSLLIIVTADLDSILPTILSRLQQIYFGAVPASAIAGQFAAKAFGKPGLAWHMEHDEAFQKAIAQAEAFLATAPAARRDFIKKLLEPDEFSLRKFLDAVIIVLAWAKPSKTRTALSHRALALARDVSNFSLNPRLQLENLFINP